jgi:hypothetical protein
MPVESKQINRIDLPPEEIIRRVKFSYRICSYLFNTGAIWLGLGGALNFYAIFHDRSASEDPLIWMTVIVLILIGTAIFTLAFAVTLAIYRCPVCDKYLSRFRADKLRCPSCDAKVK